MSELVLKPGNNVVYQGKACRIEAPISLDRTMLADLETHEKIIAPIVELAPTPTDISFNARENVSDLILISDDDWQEAKRRQLVLEPLASQTKCTLEQANEAAQQLNLSWRQIYSLLKRYRAYDKQLLALIPQQPTGGKGKTRIPFITEKIIHDAIQNRYLTRQQLKTSLLVEEIIICCKRAGIIPPAERTIRRRIESLTNKELEKRQGERHASKQLSPVLSSFPEISGPHEIWQMDHTPIDLIIVDDVYRKPIGRPYLTLAIDVYSRCIPGFCLTLEAPSALSVGLCLTHGIFDKESWLTTRGIKTQWLIWGKPNCLYVDNAREFHSEALKRGCEAHGIKLIYRPPGQPHYGGIIERVIGTLMQLVHALPGTTFSNIQERGDYPSDKKAVLTLPELEYWLTLAITDYYHQKIHHGIHVAPIEKYQSAILGNKEKPGLGYPIKIHNQQAFLIDFLPIEWRSLQRHGFMIDHIAYNSAALSPLIAERDKYQRFLIRRDPRDLSHIYVLEPHSNRYLKIPYRTLSRSTITLWEHRRAIEWLHKREIFEMNETLIFQAIDRMRDIVKEASQKTKSARRQQSKTEMHLKNAESITQAYRYLVMNYRHRAANSHSVTR